MFLTQRQHTADHKVKLTPEGHEQSRAAGGKLRALLRSDDTLHFFISPYRRARETTEGILQTLCSDDPAPSPFRRSQIKIYEEPRIREQDFGNFQPNRDEVDRIWRERAEYGHFFYRLPNGESGADCADRCSSFNDSLWRRFGDPDMASVAIIVSHGMVIRCFLMRWYHFSVEYFEDLRNINHVEFIVMRLKDNGRYQLQNQLRTWTEMKRERAARASISAGADAQLHTTAPIPTRRTWACPEDCRDPTHGHNTGSKRLPVRRNTADLFKDDTELFSGTPRNRDNMSSSPLAHRDFAVPESEHESVPPSQSQTSRNNNFDQVDIALNKFSMSRNNLDEPINFRGRDGGGSKSGVPSPLEGPEEDESYTDVPPGPADKSDKAHFTTDMFTGGSLGRALRGELGGEVGSPSRAMADALGDQSDAEVDEEDRKMGVQQRQQDEEDRILEDERRDRSRHGSIC